jgi:hypothetical protein
MSAEKKWLGFTPGFFFVRTYMAHLLPIGDCRLPIADWRLRTLDARCESILKAKLYEKL